MPDLLRVQPHDDRSAATAGHVVRERRTVLAGVLRTGIPLVSPGTQLLMTPTRLEFGGVPVGGTAPSQSVTLTNVGRVPVSVSLAGGAAGDFGG